MSDKDYYSTLGVSETASEDEIKKVYRKLAVKYHPDRNPGDKKSEEKFKAVSEAYYTLGDPKRRRQYDNLRKAGAYTGNFSSNQGFDFSEFFKGFESGGFSSNSAFGDIFGDIFSGQRGARTFHYSSGGAHHASREDYDAYSGEVDTDVKASLPIPHDLVKKGGEAKFRLSTGENITLTIPAGVKSGQKLRLRGQGAKCPHCRHKGDLIVTLKIK